MAEEIADGTTKPMMTCGEMMAGMKAGESPMSMCPMAAMLKRTAGKPTLGILLMIPGLLLIAVGVLIVFEPIILVWLMAAMAVLMGVVMLMIAGFLHRLGGRRAGGILPSHSTMQ